jgi:hypothetical protein
MEGIAMNCAELAEVAAELALGVLTGRERAQAIAHLDRCDACREDVRQLMATSEGLLALLPASEPEAGFETRVLDRLGLAVPADRHPVGRDRAGRETRHAARYRHARPRRAVSVRRLVASAAVSLAVLGAGVAGWGIGTARSPVPSSLAPSSAPLDSAALLSASHETVGQVFVYQGGKGQGGQQWMYMSVMNLPSGDGAVTCQVVGADGQVTTAGSFRLTGGNGAWASSGWWVGGTVHAARLLAADGTVLATATFTRGYSG